MKVDMRDSLSNFKPTQIDKGEPISVISLEGK